MLALPPGAPAQAQNAAAPTQNEDAPAAAAPTLAGSWEGWARLTSDWPGLSCRYDGGPGATSVRLELSGDAGALHGSVAIDLPAVQGSGCPPLRKRYSIAEVSLAPGTASFTDSGGNEWTLSARRSGSVLQGLLAWRQGATQEPLAEGFTRPDGVRPLARLSGEVRVVRSGSTEEGVATAAGAATPAAEPVAAAARSGGGHVGHVAAIVGANVVGLGVLYGVNKVAKGSSSTGAATCSPRFCFVGAPNSPCLCPQNSSNLVSGASCGTTVGGQPLKAPCDDKNQPCQSGLSCNNNVCEGPDDRCPY